MSLLALLALCLPLLLKSGRLSINSDPRILLQGDQRAVNTYDKVREIVTEETVVVISVEGDGLFTREGLELVRRISDLFSVQPGVTEIKSLTHSVKPVRKGFTFEMVPLVPPQSLAQSDLDELRVFATTHPLVRNVMVSGDGRGSLITVNYRRDMSTPVMKEAFQREVEALLEPFTGQDFEIRSLAVPFVENEVRATLKRDALRFGPVALVVLVPVLWLAMGSWRLLVLTWVNVFLALLFASALMAAFGIELTFYNVMLLPLLGGVLLTLLAHQYMTWRQITEEGADLETAAIEMARRIFRSCLFASLTTAIGLLSLGLSDVAQLRQFGLLGAAGVAVVFCWAFGPAVALLQLCHPRRRKPQSEKCAERRNLFALDWSKMANALVARRKEIGLTAGCLAVVACIGVSRIRTDIRAMEFLPESSPTRQMLEEFDSRYGGMNFVQIEIDSGRSSGVNHLPFLRFVSQAQEFAASMQGVSATYSYAQVLSMMNQIWEQERTGSFRLPDNPLLLGLFVTALKAQDFPFLSALTDDSFRTAYLVVRSPDMPSGQYLSMLRDIVAYAEQHKPAGVTVSAREGIHSILEADRRILRAQSGSGLATLGIVGIVLAFLWRSARLALLATLANALPVALTLALAGFAGIPLNSITVMVAAIALGLAIDDSVHLVTWWKQEMKDGGDPVAALSRTLAVKAPPIVCTSVILAGLFAAFLLTSFPPVRHFGLLSAVAFALALASVLLLLPALLGRPKHAGSTSP